MYASQMLVRLTELLPIVDEFCGVDSPLCTFIRAALDNPTHMMLSAALGAVAALRIVEGCPACRRVTFREVPVDEAYYHDGDPLLRATVAAFRVGLFRPNEHPRAIYERQDGRWQYVGLKGLVVPHDADATLERAFRSYKG